MRRDLWADNEQEQDNETGSERALSNGHDQSPAAQSWARLLIRIQSPDDIRRLSRASADRLAKAAVGAESKAAYRLRRCQTLAVDWAARARAR